MDACPPQPPAASPSRLAPARRRARLLKVASAGVAVAGFGVLSLLVRSGAHTGSAATTSTPASSGERRASSSPRGSARKRPTAARSSARAPTRAPAPARLAEPVVQSSAGIDPHLMSPRRFKAMGCEIVVGGATPSEQVAVERLFAALEASLSRFRPTSDLERLNNSPAGTVIVSPLLATALDDALRAAQATDGLCDPTIAAALRVRGLRPHLRRDRARPARGTRFPQAAGARSGSPASSSSDPSACASTSTASSRDARSTTRWRCSRATASSRPAATWRRAASSSSRCPPAAP